LEEVNELNLRNIRGIKGRVKFLFNNIVNLSIFRGTIKIAYYIYYFITTIIYIA
jgi:hypothetical protein